MPMIWKPGSDQMAERCGSRVAHDWRGYEAVAANPYCYDRDRGWPLIDAVRDRTGRSRALDSRLCCLFTLRSNRSHAPDPTSSQSLLGVTPSNATNVGQLNAPTC